MNHEFETHRNINRKLCQVVKYAEDDGCGIKNVPLLFGSTFGRKNVPGRTWRKLTCAKFYRKWYCHRQSGIVKFVNFISPEEVEPFFSFFSLEMSSLMLGQQIIQSQTSQLVKRVILTLLNFCFV